MAEPMIRDVLAWVGVATLGFWTWKAWAFALRWWEAFFARQREAQRVEDAAAASRLLVRAAREAQYVQYIRGPIHVFADSDEDAANLISIDALVSKEIGF